MSKILINEFGGINASQASLQLKGGEVGNMQNIRARPYGNWAKRQGIAFSTSQTTPVLGIFEIELDNITIPIVQNGSSLSFFQDLGTQDGTIFIMPSSVVSVDPPGNPSRITLFLVEQTMRAIQDRRAVAGHSTFSWPNILFKPNGDPTSIAVSSYPADNIYGPDLSYYDAAHGVPTGTRAAQLVNSIIQCCVDTIGLNSGKDWLNPTLIQGQSTLTYYDTTIFPANSSASPGNYRTKLSNAQTGIRKMTTIQRAASQDSTTVQSKTGTAQDSGVCSGITGATISGYSDSFFSVAGCPTLSGSVSWNGNFTNCFEPSPGVCECDMDSLVYDSYQSNHFLAEAKISGAPGSWSIEVGVLDAACSILVDLWTGTQSGATITGVYTKTGGIGASPATITIV